MLKTTKLTNQELNCHILKSISMKGIDYVKFLKNAINSLFVGKILEYLCILIPSHYSFG